MNITFFIGNGFDLNLGLKTSYSDFYPDFIEKASKTNMIREWLLEYKEKIEKHNDNFDSNEDDEPSNKDFYWSDLEETLGKELYKLKAEDVEKFYADKSELDNLLADYLEEEQTRFKIEGNEKEISKELKRSLVGFSSNLSGVGRDSINQTCDNFKSEDFKYCFICFNYTNTLDRIISLTKKSNAPITTHRSGGSLKQNYLDKLLHIHGTIYREMILAVNDADQINNTVLRNNPDFLNVFVKKNMNEVIGQKKTEAAKEIIDKSHIICIFGMSIGDTDKIWWEEIVGWLKKSEFNKLIIYVYVTGTGYRRRFPLDTYQRDKEWKNKILQKGGFNQDSPEYEKFSNRIFISYNADIFKFDGAIS